MRNVGNASSIHGDGRGARKIVEDARGEIAALVNVRPAQVIFNSGATEGNNTILSGHAGKNILVSAIEHPSVLEPAANADRIPVTKGGTIDLGKLEAMLENSKIDLVCVQLVNSETGVIQPVSDVARLAHAKGALLHCDAVQGAGRIYLDFKTLGADFLTLSAHKCGGPQGVGALIFREGLLLPKFMKGGGQEKRQRAGTENVAAIAGFGAAAKLARNELSSYADKMRSLQTRLESGFKKIADDLIVVGEKTNRVANTSNILLPGIPAETALMALDLEGVSVSSGSACSSGAFKPSHVLMAMGYDENDAKSALRFSYGWATTNADIDAALAAFETVMKRLKQ
jgi:cysteine desulfurase